MSSMFDLASDQTVVVGRALDAVMKESVEEQMLDSIATRGVSLREALLA